MAMVEKKGEGLYGSEGDSEAKPSLLTLGLESEPANDCYIKEVREKQGWRCTDKPKRC